MRLKLLALAGLFLLAGTVFADPPPPPNIPRMSLNHPNVFMVPQVSSPPIQFQNAGTPIGIAFIFNCAGGLTCAISNGVLTATGGAGTLTFPVTVVSATSGGIPCFTSTTTMASSGAITVNDAITGGGAGACAQDSNIPVSRGARTTDATNIAIGTSALSGNGANTDPHETMLGVSAGAGYNSGANVGANTGIGWNALVAANDNGDNTAVGSQALGGALSGSGANVGVGVQACNNVTSGGNNICVGVVAHVGAASDNREIVIGNSATGAGTDTALIGPATMTDLYIGSSTPNAYYRGRGLISMGTGPTITGTGACATNGSQAGGATAGTITCTGTTGASTLTITFGKTAPTGWTCDAWDETTGANLPHQTSHSQTTCVLTVTSVSANDVLVWKAIGW